MPNTVYERCKILDKLIEQASASRQYLRSKDDREEEVVKVTNEIERYEKRLEVVEFIETTCSNRIQSAQFPFKNGLKDNPSPSDITLPYFESNWGCWGCIFERRKLVEESMEPEVQGVMNMMPWSALSKEDFYPSDNVGEDGHNSALASTSKLFSTHLDAAGSKSRLYHSTHHGYDGSVKRPMDSLVVFANASLSHADAKDFNIKREDDALVTVLEIKHRKCFKPSYGRRESLVDCVVAQGLAYASNIMTHEEGKPRMTSSERFKQLRVLAINIRDSAEGGTSDFDVVKVVIEFHAESESMERESKRKRVIIDPMIQKVDLQSLVHLCCTVWTPDPGPTNSEGEPDPGPTNSEDKPDLGPTNSDSRSRSESEPRDRTE